MEKKGGLKVQLLDCARIPDTACSRQTKSKSLVVIARQLNYTEDTAKTPGNKIRLDRGFIIVLNDIFYGIALEVEKMPNQ